MSGEDRDAVSNRLEGNDGSKQTDLLALLPFD
jgi:hypothetical protein